MSSDKNVGRLFLVFCMVVVGILAVMIGIIGYIGYYASLYPGSWWPFSGPATAEFMFIVSGPAIGAWILISAYGIVKEKAWGMVSALVCFTVIISNCAVAVIAAVIANPVTFWSVWVDWVAFILLIFAVVGFLYLLITRENYK